MFFLTEKSRFSLRRQSDFRAFDRRAALFLWGILFFYATPSYAADKISDLLVRVTGDLIEISPLLSVISYILAGIYALTGVIKIKKHVDGHNIDLSKGILRLAAAGLLSGFVWFMNVLINTLVATRVEPDVDMTETITVGSNDTLSAIFVRLVNDVAPAVAGFMPVLSYFIGVIFAIAGVTRMAGNANDGPKGPGSAGTIATFVTAGILMSLPSMFDATTNTLFGGGLSYTHTLHSSVLGYSGTNTGVAAITTGVQDVFSATVKFLQVLGWIGFLRGIIVLRASIDGSQRASMSGGLAQLFGGVLAVNFAPFLRMLEKTLEIQLLT